MNSLFSYGTLQQREVQLANYGRPLIGRPDALTGYRLAPLAITDPHVIAISGKAEHTIARATGDSSDLIPGVVFELSDAELTATDAYEVDAYARAEVTLESGRTAWVYVGPPFDGAH
jgi:gamma-glutamylcyclotransferase (GGCT)/AIG2-like uncharacterized protein YtfP